MENNFNILSVLYRYLFSRSINDFIDNISSSNRVVCLEFDEKINFS